MPPGQYLVRKEPEAPFFRQQPDQAAQAAPKGRRKQRPDPTGGEALPTASDGSSSRTRSGVWAHGTGTADRTGTGGTHPGHRRKKGIPPAARTPPTPEKTGVKPFTRRAIHRGFTPGKPALSFRRAGEKITLYLFHTCYAYDII